AASVDGVADRGFELRVTLGTVGEREGCGEHRGDFADDAQGAGREGRAAGSSRATRKGRVGGRHRFRRQTPGPVEGTPISFPVPLDLCAKNVASVGMRTRVFTAFAGTSAFGDAAVSVSP